REVLADVEATGKRAGWRMARAAKAIDKGLAAGDSFGGCLDLEVRNRSATGMLLDRPDDRQRGGERHRDGQHGRKPHDAPFHKFVLDPESTDRRPHQRRGSGKHCRQAKDVSHSTSSVCSSLTETEELQ